MMSLLRLEGYKTLYNKGLWIVIAVVFVLTLLAGSAPFNFPSQYRETPLTTLKMYNKEVNIETYEDFFNWHAGEVFAKAMSYTSGITLASLVLAAYFFGTCFSGRTYNGAVYSGKSRTKIILSAMIWFFILTVLISLLSQLIILMIFAPGWYSVLPAGCILRCFAVRLLLDIGMMCIPMIIAIICRGIFKSVVFTSVAAIAAAIITSLTEGSAARFLFAWYPAIIAKNSDLWGTNASPALLISSSAIALCYVAICVAVSIFLFRRAHLK